MSETPARWPASDLWLMDFHGEHGVSVLPEIVDGTREAVEAIREVYRTEPTGGMLHVVIDDANVDEDEFLTDAFSESLVALYGRDPLPSEIRCRDLLLAMTPVQRGTAISIAHWS